MTALLEPRTRGLAGRIAAVPAAHGGFAAGPAELPHPFAPVLRELRPLVDALRGPGSPTELLARAIGFARAIGLTPIRLELSGGERQRVAIARALVVGSSRVDLQACKLEYSIVSPK